MAAAGKLRIYSENATSDLSTSAILDFRYLIGVEWRLRRQIGAWDGTIPIAMMHTWLSVELFIDLMAANDLKKYGAFRRPRKWSFRRRKVARSEQLQAQRDGLSTRYRNFLGALSNEPGYRVWARAAISGAMDPLTDTELLWPKHLIGWRSGAEPVA